MITQERAATRPAVDPDRPDVRVAWTTLLLALAVVPAVYALASPRAFAARVPSPVFGAVNATFARSMALLLVLALLALGGVLLTLALPTMRWPRPGALAVAGGVGMALAVIVSGVVKGSPGIGLGSLVAPVLLVAIGVIPKPSLGWFEDRFRTVARALLLGSLASTIVAPAWAAQQGYDGFLPVASRLAGLASHPNTLGPLAVTSLLLEVTRKDRRPLLVLLPVLALLWSQSKTSLAAAVVVAVVLFVSRTRSAPARRPWAHGVLLAGLLGVTTAFALDLAAPGQQTDRTETSAETFTGRTSIWEVTIEVWLDDPVFGYGPDLWGPAMDERYRFRVGFPPGQSHNQVLQTLGESGLIGGAALLALLAGLASLARRTHDRTRGVGTGLVVLLFVRCLTESPLDRSVVSMNFFLLASTLAYLLVASRAEGEPVAR